MQQTTRSHLLPALSIAITLMLTTTAGAEVRLPAVIGDNMVLQRETLAPLWGWADPEEEIEIRASWIETPLGLTANTEGRWRFDLPTPAAGGPHTITINGENTVELTNILIGEVWVCGGQSNMEWPVARSDNAAQEIAGANHPNIRIFNVARVVSPTPLDDCTGQWQACSPETIGPFSAVGYFFARELQSELDVPIGLIGSNWGGTLAEAWTSAEALSEMPYFDGALKTIESIQGDPEQLARMHKEKVAAWWKQFDELDAGWQEQKWSEPDFSDADWKTMKLPHEWAGTDLAQFDGGAWFRKTITLDPSWQNKALMLELGPIDDMDITYFNGKRIGGHTTENHWNTPRRYRVPASLVRGGENVIAVRVYDWGGGGGMHGTAEQMQLTRRDGEVALSIAGPWKYHVGVGSNKLPQWPRSNVFHQNFPTALYNGMLTPIVPFGMRGAIWYQGESNRTRAHQYRELLPLMIRCWRDSWGQGLFPFYIVQIAPFLYGNDTGEAAELREAQLMTMQRVPNTGTIVTMDIGNPRDIHPTNKQDVGHRLALWALAKDYGFADLVYSGPVYRSMTIEGDAIRLRFDHVGGGLVAVDGPFTHFTIAGRDRVFAPASAVIEGDTIVVSSDAVTDPVAVRFAWGAADEPNLSNAEGLPASSFRTDDWPGVTQPK